MSSGLGGLALDQALQVGHVRRKMSADIYFKRFATSELVQNDLADSADNARDIY